MKTLLVPVMGSEGDTVALESAFLIAEKFRSHLDCLHIYLGPQELMLQTANVAVGMPVISPQLWSTLEDEAKSRRKRANDTFEMFRLAKGIELRDSPGASDAITATWHEPEGDTVDEIVFAGQSSELIVMAHRSAIAISPGQVGETVPYHNADGSRDEHKSEDLKELLEL